MGSLYRDGEVVHLTPKALDVLIVLVVNYGQVAEKQYMMRQVWVDTYVEEGVLSRNIHETRKVLGDESSAPRYVKPLPKRAFLFIAEVNVRPAAPGQPLFDGDD